MVHRVLRVASSRTAEIYVACGGKASFTSLQTVVCVIAQKQFIVVSGDIAGSGFKDWRHFEQSRGFAEAQFDVMQDSIVAGTGAAYRHAGRHLLISVKSMQFGVIRDGCGLSKIAQAVRDRGVA